MHVGVGALSQASRRAKAGSSRDAGVQGGAIFLMLLAHRAGGPLDPERPCSPVRRQQRAKKMPQLAGVVAQVDLGRRGVRDLQFVAGLQRRHRRHLQGIGEYILKNAVGRFCKVAFESNNICDSA